jgi:hypothetical protein
VLMRRDLLLAWVLGLRPAGVTKLIGRYVRRGCPRERARY